MFETIKDNLEKVVEISNSCPEKYQVKCFQVLLEALTREKPEKDVAFSNKDVSRQNKSPFFAQNNISDEQWPKVYHNDGNGYKVIVNDLKEKTTAKRQVKLGLLLGVKNLLESNEAFVSKEELMEACKQYSCYDASNFSSYMKKNKNVFLSKGNGWALTVPGQQKAAEAIKDLA
ncbi:hypothetical protein ACFLWU_05335 [Chloroflexota bacterium]